MSTLNRPVKPGNYNISTKDTIPASVALTGTFSTNNSDSYGGTYVTGSGTLFTTEILDTNVVHPKLYYKYLFNPATTEVRKIKYVLNDTGLMLESPFSASAATGTPVSCPNPLIIYKEVSVLVPSTDTSATINGASVVAGTVDNFARNAEGILPIAVDGTGGPLQIQTEQ